MVTKTSIKLLPFCWVFKKHLGIAGSLGKAITAGS